MSRNKLSNFTFKVLRNYANINKIKNCILGFIVMVDSSLRVYQGIIKAVSDSYKAAHNTTQKPVDIDTIDTAYAAWRTDTPTDPDREKRLVTDTLNNFAAYLGSSESPYAVNGVVANDRTFRELINVVKEGSMLDRDIRSNKYDSGTMRKDFMKRVTHFMKNVAQLTQAGQTETVRGALTDFPMRTQGEYACVGGSQTRLTQADMALQKPYVVALTAGYSDVAEKQVAHSVQYVFPGNQVHTKAAIDYLLGIPEDVVEDVDDMYKLALGGMRAYSIWPMYVATLDLGSTVREQIKPYVQSAMMHAVPQPKPKPESESESESESEPEPETLIKPVNLLLSGVISSFLTPWGIDPEQVLEEQYDEETYEIKRQQVSTGDSTRPETDAELNARIEEYVGKLASDRINAYMSTQGIDTPDIEWNKLQSEGISIDELDTTAGQAKLTDALRSISTLSPDNKITTTLQQAALHALFLFSQHIAEANPIMVVAILHELGSDSNGYSLDNSKEVLRKIAQNNPEASHLIQSTFKNLDKMLECPKTKAYADFLNDPESIRGKANTYILELIVLSVPTDQIFDIISRIPIDIMKEENSGDQNILRSLIDYDNVEIFGAILEKIPELIVQNTPMGSTPIEDIIIHDRADFFERAVQAVPEILTNPEIFDGLLDKIAFYRSPKIFDITLDAKPDLVINKNSTDISVDSSLLYGGGLWMLKLLISKFPQILEVEPEKHNSFLLEAVTNNNLTMIEAIIGIKPEYLQRTDKDGNTISHLAAHCGSARALDYLLCVISRENNSLDIQNNEGKTVLSEAASEGHEDAVHILIMHNIAWETKDALGRTAEDHARLNGHYNIANLLNNITNLLRS